MYYPFMADTCLVSRSARLLSEGLYSDAIAHVNYINYIFTLFFLFSQFLLFGSFYSAVCYQ